MIWACENEKKLFIVIGVIVLIIFVLIGGFFLFNKYNLFNKNLDKHSSLEEQINYAGEQITIMHKDFRAIIKADWQEFEFSPSIYVYLPPNTTQENINAEGIYITTTFLGENHQLTLNGLLEQGVEVSKQIMPDFELIENLDSGNKNLVGKRIKFTGTQDGIKRNNLQFFGIKYNILYAITYSCPINNCNSYAIYNTLVESFEPVEAA